MRITAKIEPKTYDRIEKYVRNGEYSHIEQFIRVALQNQLSLENGQIDDSVSVDIKENLDQEWGYKVPPHVPVNSPYEMNREIELLFQQYYRFFPLKVVMVKLANTTIEIDGPVRLQNFRENMRNEIKPIRNAIQSWEEKNDVKKRYKKSTGLPKTDVKNPEYSMKRFLDHYVGKIRNRDNVPQGFGNSTAFISYEPIEDGCLVQLTPRGKEFIDLDNPLLSRGPEEPVLSKRERKFIIEQINTVLPEETRFMKLVYETLEDNNNSYTKHLDVFEEFLKESRGFPENDPSENRVRSTTAGIISRMVELNILKRGKKRGVYNANEHPTSI